MARSEFRMAGNTVVNHTTGHGSDASRDGWWRSFPLPANSDQNTNIGTIRGFNYRTAGDNAGITYNVTGASRRFSYFYRVLLNTDNQQTFGFTIRKNNVRGFHAAPAGFIFPEQIVLLVREGGRAVGHEVQFSGEVTLHAGEFLRLYVRRDLTVTGFNPDTFAHNNNPTANAIVTINQWEINIEEIGSV